jgi:hypothetical protein
MIKLVQKPSSGCAGGEVVGGRAAEHRDKANGIDEARGEGPPATPAAMPTTMAEPTTPASVPVMCMKRSAANSPARYWMDPVAALIASQPNRAFRRSPGVSAQDRNVTRRAK